MHFVVSKVVSSKRRRQLKVDSMKNTAIYVVLQEELRFENHIVTKKNSERSST